MKKIKPKKSKTNALAKMKEEAPLQKLQRLINSKPTDFLGK